MSSLEIARRGFRSSSVELLGMVFRRCPGYVEPRQLLPAPPSADWSRVTRRSPPPGQSCLPPAHWRAARAHPGNLPEVMGLRGRAVEELGDFDVQGRGDRGGGVEIGDRLVALVARDRVQRLAVFTASPSRGALRAFGWRTVVALRTEPRMPPCRSGGSLSSRCGASWSPLRRWQPVSRRPAEASVTGVCTRMRAPRFVYLVVLSLTGG